MIWIILPCFIDSTWIHLTEQEKRGKLSSIDEVKEHLSLQLWLWYLWKEEHFMEKPNVIVKAESYIFCFSLQFCQWLFVQFRELITSILHFSHLQKEDYTYLKESMKMNLLTFLKEYEISKDHVSANHYWFSHSCATESCVKQELSEKNLFHFPLWIFVRIWCLCVCVCVAIIPWNDIKTFQSC